MLSTCFSTGARALDPLWDPPAQARALSARICSSRNELCQLDREEENLADGHLGYIELTPLDEFRNSSNRNEKYLERQVVTFTVAFGTTAPVGSVTTPVMDPNNP
jgi:hypothetical protein